MPLESLGYFSTSDCLENNTEIIRRYFFVIELIESIESIWKKSIFR
jgi:hypothetical protein